MKYEKFKAERKNFLFAVFGEYVIEYFIIPTVIFTNAFLVLIGIPIDKIVMISSVILLSHISQVFASKIVFLFNSRKKSVITLSLISYGSFIMIPFSLSFGDIGFFITCILYFIGFSAKFIKTSISLDWIINFVDPSKSARYFSKRNIIVNSISMIYNILFGFLVDKFRDNIMFFYISFVIVLFFSIIDLLSYMKIPDIKDNIDKNNVRIIDIFKIPLCNKNFVIYIIFVCFWNFGLYLSQPYYTYYFVDVVGISYVIVGSVISITNLFKIFMGGIWGRLVDLKGCFKIIILTSIGFAVINSLFSLISIDGWILYPILFLLQGVCMIGFNISKFNVSLSLIPKDIRIMFMNFEGFVTGIVSFIAPQISRGVMNFIIENKIRFLNFSSYQLIFILGGGIQILAIIILIILNKKTHKQI